MTQNVQHKPVMVDQVVDGLVWNPNGIYVDATFGQGGHARAILAKLGPDAKYFAFDRDPRAVAHAADLAKEDPRVHPRKAKFSEIRQLLAEEEKIQKVSGVLLDVGLSSEQLEDASRGFSFLKDGPLDMRMDDTQGQTAAAWLNHEQVRVMHDVLNLYGNEKNSMRIAARLDALRPISTTFELNDIIRRAITRVDPNKHPSTRTFQALRIYINDEMEELRIGIEDTYQLLDAQGRLAVITFHSLETRVVHRQFRHLSDPDSALPRGVPVRGAQSGVANHLIKKERPDEEEVDSNPRARSAIFHLLERAS